MTTDAEFDVLTLMQIRMDLAELDRLMDEIDELLAELDEVAE